MFSIIAAIGKNRELGKNNQLIFHIKEDMRFFKDTTTGHKILMGRKTWDSIGRPLPNRMSIVVSRGEVPGADLVVHDLPAFISEHQDTDEEIFVIGGALIYNELIKYAKHLYLTEVDATDPTADAFFPVYDKSKYSRTVIKKGKDDDLAYAFVKYTKLY